MKKLFTLTLALLMLTALVIPTVALNADELSAYGQNTYTIYEVAGEAPVADGKVTPNEYGAPIQTILDVFDETVSYYTLSEAAEKYAEQILHASATLYMTYDADYLYVAFVVSDDSHYTPFDNQAMWDGDYMEIDFMPIGTPQNKFDRLRLALGVNNMEDIYAYYASEPNYLSGYQEYANDQLINDNEYRSASHDNGTTTYELRLPWMEIMGTLPKSFLNYVQLGISHEDLFELSEYEAYLGVWRNIPKLNDADRAGIAAEIGCVDDDVDRRIFNIIVLGGKADGSPSDIVFPEDTTALETEEPITEESVTEESTTEEPITEKVETEPEETEPEETEPEETETSGTKPVIVEPDDSSFPVILVVVATVAVLALAAVGVDLARKKKQ